jgi:hypothetical protein
LRLQIGIGPVNNDAGHGAAPTGFSRESCFGGKHTPARLPRSRKNQSPTACAHSTF